MDIESHFNLFLLSGLQSKCNRIHGAFDLHGSFVLFAWSISSSTRWGILMFPRTRKIKKLFMAWSLCSLSPAQLAVLRTRRTGLSCHQRDPRTQGPAVSWGVPRGESRSSCWSATAVQTQLDRIFLVAYYVVWRNPQPTRIGWSTELSNFCLCAAACQVMCVLDIVEVGLSKIKGNQTTVYSGYMTCSSASFIHPQRSWILIFLQKWDAWIAQGIEKFPWWNQHVSENCKMVSVV